MPVVIGSEGWEGGKGVEFMCLVPWVCCRVEIMWFIVRVVEFGWRVRASVTRDCIVVGLKM